jgi:hypothetical protein
VGAASSAIGFGFNVLEGEPDAFARRERFFGNFACSALSEIVIPPT